MAYRVKGLLTLQQRRELGGFVREYRELASRSDLPESANYLLAATLYPFTLLSRAILLLDEQVILRKTVFGREAKREEK